jgi:hypothetical protein
MKNTLLYKITLGFLFLLLTYTTYLNAQNLPAMIYGGSHDERCFAIVEATNLNGYVLAGWTKSFGTGTPNFSNVLVVRTDSFGIPEGAVVSQGVFDDEAHSLTQTVDGGYAITGWTKSYGSPPGDSTDIFVVKLDSSGIRQWGFVYGTPFCEEAYSIIQTMDGGYAVTGWTNMPTMMPTNPPNIFLFRTDPSGMPLFTIIYWFPINLEDEGYSLCEIPGVGMTDSYLIAGRAKVFDPIHFDAFVMQTDPGGMPIGLASVVPGPLTDEAYSVIWGGEAFVAAGWSNSFSVGGDADIIIWADDTAVGSPVLGTANFGWLGEEKVMDDRSLAGISGYWAVSGWTTSVGPGVPDPNFLIIGQDTSGWFGRVHPSAPGEDDEQAYPMAWTSKGSAIAGFTNSSWSLGGDDFHLLTLDHAFNRPVCVIDTLPPGVEFPVLEEGFIGEPNLFVLVDSFFVGEIEVMYDEICSIIPGMTDIPGDCSTADLTIFSTFNSVTLQIGKTGRLEVNLYDVIGRHVCSLAHGMYEKGLHVFTIPKNMSAGVYFVRVNFEGIEQSEKMVRYR